MPDPTSRYRDAETAFMMRADGTSVAYLRRRLVPAPVDDPLATTVVTRDGERLDLLASRALGDPLQFWRLADADGAIDPMELIAEPGRVLKAPLTQL